MIIDSHVHAGLYPDHFHDPFAAEMMAAVDHAPDEMHVDIATLLSRMDAAGVDKAFLLAFDVQRTLGIKVPNDYVADVCAAHPDRFFGFCSFDGADPQAASALEQCVLEWGMRGLKTAPAYLKLSPADPCWYPLYEAAQRLRIPVLIHTGFTPIRAAEPRFFPPALVADVARDFPDLRIILAHLGTPWVLPCVDLLAQYPNLYADLSIFGWFQPVEMVAKTLAAARSKAVLSRILWGTDYPMCAFEGFLARMEQLTQEPALFPDGVPLSRAELQALMGENALMLVA